MAYYSTDKMVDSSVFRSVAQSILMDPLKFREPEDVNEWREAVGTPTSSGASSSMITTTTTEPDASSSTPATETNTTTSFVRPLPQRLPVEESPLDLFGLDGRPVTSTHDNMWEDSMEWWLQRVS